MYQVPQGARIYGIQLPIQAQSTYFVVEWEWSSGPAEMARIAQVCDRNDYAYVGVCDHVALPESVAGSMGTHWVDPISTLGYLAAVTEKVNLLTHVYVLPYRHPLMAAEQFATLDHLSNGRAICYIRRRPRGGRVRPARCRLRVGAVQPWRTGIPVLAAALENEFVDGFGAKPRPVQSPRPPIWVAGSSPAAIRRAARVADGWLPQGPSNADMVATRRERERVGCADGPMMIGHITPFLYVGAPGWDVGDATVAGSPDAIAAAILAGTASGVNQLQVRFKARDIEEYCDQLAAFATDIAPLVTTI